MPTTENNLDARPVLALKKGEDKRLRAGHLWVFSNEVDIRKTPLKDFAPGQVANLLDSRGQTLGSAMVNPASLIAARLISHRPDVVISTSWLVGRLRQALAHREDQYDEPFYRLVFAEADGLPGLILDRFGPVLVGQLNTAGMDQARPAIEEAIRKVIDPQALLWRNDSSVRGLEGLPRNIEPGFGEMPELIEVREGGLQYSLDPVAGQKTGWYFDQAANRQRVQPMFGPGQSVLDLYCYHGAWGLTAARAGATEITCVDASEAAVERVRANAEANGLGQAVRSEVMDVETFLQECVARKQRFDCVIVDPPALVRKGKDVKPGLAKYRRINELALRVVNYGGVLVSCSCSSHVREPIFADMLRKAARHVDRELQVFMRLEQGMDHPVVPAIPETRYLKGLVARVLPTF